MMHAPRSLVLAVATAGLLHPVIAAPLAAQGDCGVRVPVCPEPKPPILDPDTGRDGSSLQVLAINTAIGATTAALVAYVRGRPVMRAAAVGALGGAVVYSGKHLATQDFDGAGLLARQVGAMGASLTRDAIEGVTPFRRVVLPLGVARLHVDATADVPVRLRADLASIVAVTAILLQGDRRLDVARSLSNGAPTFRLHRPESMYAGGHVAGVLWFNEAWTWRRRETVAHELVHLVQHDASFITWAEPLERAALPAVPGLRWVHRWADVGLHVPVRISANALLSYESRPWEWEAHVLSGTESRVPASLVGIHR